MDWASRAQVALEGLGATAAEVARTLRAAGYGGEPANVWWCPVALYLREATGLAASVAYSYATLVSPRPPYELVTVPLPAPIREFVDRFDDAGWAAFEEEP